MIAMEKARFDIYCWKKSNTGSFTDQLFDLICKADIGNRASLMNAFPFHVLAHQEWMEGDDSVDFWAAMARGDRYTISKEAV